MEVPTQFKCSTHGQDYYPPKITRVCNACNERAIEVFREKSNRQVPLIHYAKVAATYTIKLSLDIDALSLDWRDDLRWNRENFGDKIAIQGNLRSSRMHGSPGAAKIAARTVLEQAGYNPGYIFNLGHGFAPGQRLSVLSCFA